VAGHDDRDGIAAVGGTDGARGGGVSEGVGDLLVAAGFAEGDGEELLPTLALEFRAAQVDGEIEGAAGAGEVFGELAFGGDEDGVVGGFGGAFEGELCGEGDVVGALVCPEEGDDGVVGGDEAERADG